MLNLHQITIAYPDTADLRKLAEQLVAHLQHYHIPKQVRTGTGIQQLSDVKEPWLIVLCTPDTPNDPSVLEQIRLFTEQGLYQHILALLVEGEPEQSFPEPLLKEQRPDGTVIFHEPLAANIALPGAGWSMKKLKVEKLRLLAPILGVSFDELMNRQRRQKVRILTAVAAAVLAGACAFLAITIHRASVFSRQQEELSVQYEKTNDAKDLAMKEQENMQNSYAAAIGVEASKLLKEGDVELAMLLCLEFLPEYGEVEELTDTLQQALEMRCAAGYVPVTSMESPSAQKPPRETTRTFDEFREASGLENIDWYYEDEGYTITCQDDKALLYRTDPLEYLFSIENDHTREVQDYTFEILSLPSGKDYLIHGDYVYDIETGGFVKKMEFGYGSSVFRQSISSEGYILCRRGNSQLFVIDIINENMIASLYPPFYPITTAEFAGNETAENGRPDSSSILVNGILFTYRDEAQEVPEKLDGQISLARELLAERTLTEEEKAYYSIVQ